MGEIPLRTRSYSVLCAFCTKLARKVKMIRKKENNKNNNNNEYDLNYCKNRAPTSMSTMPLIVATQFENGSDLLVCSCVA